MSKTCIMDPHFKQKHIGASKAKYALYTDEIEISKQVIMCLFIQIFCFFHNKKNTISLC